MTDTPDDDKAEWDGVVVTFDVGNVAVGKGGRVMRQ